MTSSNRRAVDHLCSWAVKWVFVKCKSTFYVKSYSSKAKYRPIYWNVAFTGKDGTYSYRTSTVHSITITITMHFLKIAISTSHLFDLASNFATVWHSWTWYRTVGHKSHNPFFHVFLMEAGVMTFVANSTLGSVERLDLLRSAWWLT